MERLSPTSRTLIVMPGSTNLMQLAISLSRSRLPVLDTNCTGCLERQVYLASRWRENCQIGIHNSVHTPRETFLPNQPYWRVRISSALNKWIETLQSIYERAGRSFDDDPPSSAGVFRRTARRATGHIHYQRKVGLSAAPQEWISPPLDEVSRP